MHSGGCCVIHYYMLPLLKWMCSSHFRLYLQGYLKKGEAITSSLPVVLKSSLLNSQEALFPEKTPALRQKKKIVCVKSVSNNNLEIYLENMGCLSDKLITFLICIKIEM